MNRFRERWDPLQLTDGIVSPAMQREQGESKLPLSSWYERYRRAGREHSNWAQDRFVCSTLTAHSGTVTCLGFDASGECMISGSDDGSLRLWQPGGHEWADQLLETPPQSPLLQQHHRQTSVPRSWVVFRGHGGPVWCLDWDLQRNQLISGSYDQTIKVWDVATGSCTQTLRGHHGWVSAVATTLSPMVVSGSWDATVKVWDLQHGVCVSSIGTNESVQCLSMDTRSPGALVCGQDHAVSIIDVERSMERESLSVHGTVADACIDEHANCIAAACQDCTVKLWDARSAKGIGMLRGHTKAVMSVSMDGPYRMLTGSYDTTMKLWDLRVRSCMRTIEAHAGAVFVCGIVSNSIVSGSADATVKVFTPAASR